MTVDPHPSSARPAGVDPAEAERLLAEIRPAVARFVRGHCALLPSPPDAVDDVVQEACLAILAALPSYTDRGHRFTTFAFAVALNKARDAYREAARVPRPTFDIPDGPDPGPGPEQVAERLTDVAYVSSLLRLLPDTAREIVLLRIAAGLTVAETAEILRMSDSAVRVAQHRALKRLRELAGEAGRP